MVLLLEAINYKICVRYLQIMVFPIQVKTHSFLEQQVNISTAMYLVDLSSIKD